MSSAASMKPRWGNLARDRKAAAIAATLSGHCGEDVLRGRWLDVGCGSGGIAAGLSRHVDDIVGVDPEPWEEWVEAKGRFDNLSFKVAAFDAPELPVEPSSFDVVICNQVYEHVADPRQLLRNIHSALRPGGRCYFAGPNLLWPIEPHVFWPFVHWLPRGLAHRLMTALGSRRVAEFDAFSSTSWTLKRWFREAGFSVESALSGRVRVELDLRGDSAMSSLSRWIPGLMWEAVLPVAPGFVFVLSRES